MVLAKLSQTVHTCTAQHRGIAAAPFFHSAKVLSAVRYRGLCPLFVRRHFIPHRAFPLVFRHEIHAKSETRLHRAFPLVFSLSGEGTTRKTKKQENG